MCKERQQDNFSDDDTIKVCPYNYFTIALLEKLGFSKPNQDTIDLIEDFIRETILEWNLRLVLIDE